MQQYIKLPIPQKMNLLCLADRWNIPNESAAYQMAEFINSDHLRVMVKYEGFYGFSKCRLSEVFESPMISGRWLGDDFGWQFKNGFDFELYINLRNKNDRWNIKRGEELTDAESNTLLSLEPEYWKVMGEKPYYFPDKTQGNFYGSDAVGERGSIHFDQLFFFENNDETQYKLLYPIESTGEKENQKFRYVGLSRSLRDVFVLKKDLIEFEQHYGIFDHGLKSTYFDPIDKKSEANKVGFGSDNNPWIKRQKERADKWKPQALDELKRLKSNKPRETKSYYYNLISKIEGVEVGGRQISDFFDGELGRNWNELPFLIER